MSTLDTEAVENVAIIFKTLRALFTKYDIFVLPKEGIIIIPTICMYNYVTMMPNILKYFTVYMYLFYSTFKTIQGFGKLSFGTF